MQRRGSRHQSKNTLKLRKKRTTGSCKPCPRLVAVRSDISIHRFTGSCFCVSLRVLDDCANLHWKAYKIPESVLQDALQRAMQNQPLGYSMVDSVRFVPYCILLHVVPQFPMPDLLPLGANTRSTLQMKAASQPAIRQGKAGGTPGTPLCCSVVQLQSAQRRSFCLSGLDSASDLAFAQFDCLGSVLKTSESQEGPGQTSTHPLSSVGLTWFDCRYRLYRLPTCLVLYQVLY